jgi:hypothetical protein
MRAPTRLFAAAAVALAAATCVAVPADAAPSVTHYASCAAVHRHWSGGIAKKGVTKNTIKHSNGTTTKTVLKGKVTHSTALYEANKKLDRDKDGVACEKS